MLANSTVLLLLIVIYVLAVGIGGWLLFDDERRQQWLRRFQSKFETIRVRAGGLACNASQRTSAIPSSVLSISDHIWKWLLLRKWSTLVALSVLTTPAFLAMTIASRRGLEGYDDSMGTTDPVVIALLHGEQLVAPPALPPELFLTKEVEAVRQELAGASREWMALDADFRQRLLTVYQLMAGHGYHMALLEGYRSPERQTLLAKLGTHVTNAGAFQSYHQYGFAADSAFYRHGKLVISERDPWAMEGYRLYGAYAESVGLTWGGRWRLMDFGHVELRKPNILGRR